MVVQACGCSFHGSRLSRRQHLDHLLIQAGLNCVLEAWIRALTEEGTRRSALPRVRLALSRHNSVRRGSGRYVPHQGRAPLTWRRISSFCRRRRRMACHSLKIARAIRITIATINRVNQPPLHGATVEWSLIWVLHAKTPKKSPVLGSLAIVRFFFPFRGTCHPAIKKRL